MKKDITLNEIRNKESRRKKVARFAIALIVMILISSTAFAENPTPAGGNAFITKGVETLSTIVKMLGGILAALGLVNLLDGYGNDNPGSRNQGGKQFMAGAALFLVADNLIPLLKNIT